MNNFKVKFPKVSRLIALGLIISLLTGCASSARNANTPRSIPDGAYSGLNTGEQIGIGLGSAIVAGLIGYAIHETLSEDGKNPNDPSWDTNGPIIPEHFNFSDLKIGGYVQGGWPFAIDYQLSRPGSAVLVISTNNNEKPFTYQLNGTNISRQIKILKLPQTLGDAPVRAILEVHATENTNGINSLVPIKIFGIACGTKAVGSIGIDQIDFGPDSIKVSLGEKAHHSFFAHKSFSKVHEEFRRIDKIGMGANETTLTGSIAYTHILDPFNAIDESSGAFIGKDNPPLTWDGKTEQKRLSKGFHQLLIRAWYTNAKDWVTAFSPGQVDVKD